MNKPEFPAGHQPGMRVPKGGSSCASCEYYKGNMTCGNQYFIAWHGSNRIPAPAPDEYCSDWWEPAEKKAGIRVGEQFRSSNRGRP